MNKKEIIQVGIVTLIMSVLIGWGKIQEVYATLVPQYSYGTWSIAGTPKNVHYQYLGQGVAGVDFTSITFYITGGSQYSMGSGATGFGFKCHEFAYPNFTSEKTCTGLGSWSAPTVWNLTRSTVTSSFPVNSSYYPPARSDILKIKVSQSGVDVGTGRYAYFIYNAGYISPASSDINRTSIIGNELGTGAYYMNDNSGQISNLFANSASDSILSWAYCLNGDSDCGNEQIPYGDLVTSTSPEWTGKARYLLSGSGDFLFGGSGFSVAMYIDRFCTAGSGSYNYSRQALPVAKVSWQYGQQESNTIMTDARVDYVDSWVHDGTEPFYLSFYKGEGYNTGTTWSFHNVVVEYELGMNCTYPYHYMIYNPNGTIRVSGSEVVVPDIASENIIMSPSAPPLSDPIGWLGYQIRQAFNDIFYYGVDPDQTYTFYNLQQQIATKAPFIYASHIFSLSSAPVADTFCQGGGNCVPFGGGGGGSYSDSSFATLSFDFSGAGLPSQSWSPPTVLYQFFGTLKEFIRVVLWLGFALYVMNLGHRLFHHYE